MFHTQHCCSTAPSDHNALCGYCIYLDGMTQIIYIIYTINLVRLCQYYNQKYNIKN